MGKDAGPSNQLNSFWICWSMSCISIWFDFSYDYFKSNFKVIILLVLLCHRWKVWMSMLYTFLISMLIKHRSKDAAPTELMEESTYVADFVNITNLMDYYHVLMLWVFFFFCSLHVIYATLSWYYQRRASEEKGNDWPFLC